jgi:LPS sulfotransferase NodH
VSDEQERRAPAYDRRAITIAMQAIARGQARWELWFAVNGITPLGLGYESLMADPDAAVAGIARLVGVEGAAIDWTRVSAGVMRDGLNEEWKQRYLAEAASPDAVPEIEDLSLRGILRSIGRALR